MGRALRNHLHEKGEPFVTIDNDPDAIATAAASGYLYVEDDAMTETALHRAGLNRAKGLVSCLNTDADNVFVTLTGGKDPLREMVRP